MWNREEQTRLHIGSLTFVLCCLCLVMLALDLLLRNVAYGLKYT